jgi:hypothetical protein
VIVPAVSGSEWCSFLLYYIISYYYFQSENSGLELYFWIISYTTYYQSENSGLKITFLDGYLLQRVVTAYI